MTKAEYLKEWKLKNPDKVAKHRATEKETFKSDPQKIAAHNRNTLTNYHKLRHRIFDILGWSCARCGFDDYRALQVDHIYGGGGKQRSRVNSYCYFKEILQDPNVKAKYQTLCANCNWIKRAENNENSRFFMALKEFGPSGAVLATGTEG